MLQPKWNPGIPHPHRGVGKIKKSANLPRGFSNLRGRFVNLQIFFSSGVEDFYYYFILTKYLQFSNILSHDFIKSLNYHMSEFEDIKNSLNFKKLFWNDLLRSTGSGVLLTLIVNCSFLIIIEALFTYPFDGDEKLNLGYKAFRPRISNWLALNLIALFVFFVILIVPEPYLNKFNLCTMDLWNNTGYLIIMVRLMSLSISIFKTKVFKTQTCYLLDIQYDDGTFLFPLVSIILDVIYIRL